jgi:hypothetical protein
MKYVVVHKLLKVFYNCNIWWWLCKAETCCTLILNSSKFELWLMVPLFLFYIHLAVGRIHERLLEGRITGVHISCHLQKRQHPFIFSIVFLWVWFYFLFSLILLFLLLNLFHLHKYSQFPYVSENLIPMPPHLTLKNNLSNMTNLKTGIQFW